MKGAIIANGYLKSEKFDEPIKMMSDAAERHGLEFDVFCNNEICAPIGGDDRLYEIFGESDFIVFWDKDVKLAKNLEICGYPVFNCSECIRLCDDKSLTHLTLAEWNIPSVRTFVSPMTFGKSYGDWLSKIKDEIAYPMIAKDCFGSFGEQVRMIRSDEDLMKESDGVPKIFQEYIDCGCQDIRIEVVGGRAVASVIRTAAEGDFRSNATLGGRMEPYDPTDEEKELAIDAANAVEADFAGVDILRGKDGPLVCEVNSNAHIKNLKDSTGIDVSDFIIEHIMDVIG